MTTSLLIMLLAGSARLSFASPGDDRPVAVIFSASYGGGHDAPAATMAAELARAHPGVRVEILRAQHYFRGAGVVPRLGDASTAFFDAIYQRAPRVWNHIFDHTIRSAEGILSAGDIPNPLFSRRRMLADLRRLDPVAIYSTFHIMTSKLIGLREDGLLDPRVPIAWLDTDLILENFYALHSRGIDRTFIAHPALAEARVAMGVPAEKMVTTGLFVDPFARAEFSESDRREFLRRATSLPDQAASTELWINGRVRSTRAPDVRLNPDVRTVVISSGRAGVGDYPRVIRGLVEAARARDQRIQIVAVCGENRRNYDALTRMFDWRNGVNADVTLVVSKVVDHAKLLRLVRSADLVIGKPGSLSSFEAATMGTPRVLIDIVGGQERWGAKFFAERGLAEVVTARDQDSAGARGLALLENAARLERMRAEDQIIRDAYDLKPISAFFAEAARRRACARALK